MTFHWLYPLIHKGRYQTLNEEDVWNLSVTLRCKPVFIKFSNMKYVFCRFTLLFLIK